ncbi:helix-turn-helix domain-containing protein [Aquisediminimonas sediminicola]|uniref:helix-turn-helix domain-containing protein n=1 Tax=Alteraquisediminimonas sediminicola TaxID=2676787 RepID=UPI001C8EF7FF|nr:AraC family transcriptional regulator [Aquisediminimonas sediminicola]
MAELVTIDELPRWVPGTMLESSQDLGWKNVGLRSYRYPGHDVLLPGLQDFMIVAYLEGATKMQRRFESAWTQTQCAPGKLSLLTRSQDSHWFWPEKVDVCHVYLSEKIIAGVAFDVLGRSIADVTLRDILSLEDPIMSTLVQAFRCEAAAGGVGGAIYAEALGVQMAVHLLRNYADVQIRDKATGKRLASDFIRRAQEYIESNLGQSLTLEDIAAEVGLGTWTFGKLFRETLGRSPHTYVIERRVERAERFLKQENMPLKEIAFACGFADQAHMTRVFRTLRNVTPGSLRPGRTAA